MTLPPWSLVTGRPTVDIAAVLAEPGGQRQGSVRARVRLEGLHGPTEATARLTKAVITPPSGALPLPGELLIDEAEVTLHCRSQRCRIARLTAVGPQGALRGTGELIPRRPWTSSELSLTVELIPSRALLHRDPAGGLMPGTGAPVRLRLNGPLSRLHVEL